MEKGVDKRVVSLFVMAEVILYIIFFVQDIEQVPSEKTKYFTICLCLLMAVYIFVKQKAWLLMVAMVFTLIADTFLLLLNNNYLVGVLAFCVVQIIYAARLVLVSGRWTIILRLILFGLALFILKMVEVTELVAVASAWSYTWLLSNVIHSFIIGKRYMGGKVFAWGLLLFLCCDTCVGINNVQDFLVDFPFPDIIPVASFGMWLFYLPSQILIVLSFCDKRKDDLNYETK